MLKRKQEEKKKKKKKKKIGVKKIGSLISYDEHQVTVFVIKYAVGNGQIHRRRMIANVV